MSTQLMKTLVEIGHRPHPINRKKYGNPRVALYWAERGNFTRPGLYLWTGKRNRRVIAFPRPRLD